MKTQKVENRDMREKEKEEREFITGARFRG